MNRKVVPERQCSSRLGTTERSGRCEIVHYRREATMICPPIKACEKNAIVAEN